MTMDYRQLTNEFDALLTRAMRQGTLDPTELVDTYQKLQLSPPEPAEQIRRLASHLQSLPADLFACEEVTVVHQLEGLPYAPLPSRSSPFQSAWQETDEHLLVEMNFGKVSLVHFATHLCALAEYYLQTLETFGAPGQFAHREGLSHEAMAQELQLPTDELDALFEATHQLLPRLLVGELTFPELHIHASLNPENLNHAIHQAALGLLQTLAESGFTKRPLHLWIGNDLPVHHLSPYSRDLNEQLHSWAQQNPERLGPDIPHPASSDPDVLYAVALDFLNSDATLQQERHQANREAGIQHLTLLNQPCEVVDLSQLDHGATDARLSRQAPTSPCPVLIRLPHLLEDSEGQLLRTLTQKLGPALHGVTLAMPGSHLGHPPGSLLLPDLVLRWAGHRKTPLPIRSALQEVFPQNEGGVLLTCQSGALISTGQLNHLSKELRLTGLNVGFGGLLEALADALWSGHLSPHCRVQWPMVAQDPTHSLRPSLAEIQAWAQVIHATLRPLLGAAPHSQNAPSPATTKKRAPAPKMNYPPPSGAKIRDLNEGPVLPPPDFEEPAPKAPPKGPTRRIKV